MRAKHKMVNSTSSGYVGESEIPDYRDSMTDRHTALVQLVIFIRGTGVALHYPWSVY
jgi:hypothetical protein